MLKIDTETRNNTLEYEHVFGLLNPDPVANDYPPPPGDASECSLSLPTKVWQEII